MKPMPLIAAVVLLAASTSTVFARGQFGGPIGPGSRDGLQPSVNDFRPNAFAYERKAPVVKMRTKKPQRR